MGAIAAACIFQSAFEGDKQACHPLKVLSAMKPVSPQRPAGLECPRANGDAAATNSSFSADLAAGLSSVNFDLLENLESGDRRAGLEDMAKDEILRIMKEHGLRADDARKAYVEKMFMLNGIAMDGLPMDPKFVCFSR